MDPVTLFLLGIGVVGASVFAAQSTKGDGRRRLEAAAGALLAHRDSALRTVTFLSSDLLVWRSRGRGGDVEGRAAIDSSGTASLALEVCIPGLGAAQESLSHRRGPYKTALDCWEDPAVRKLVDTLEKRRLFSRLVLDRGQMRLERAGRGARQFDISEIEELESMARALAHEVARVRGLSMPNGRPCLTCPGTHLEEGVGPAGEDVCRRCGGRFLPPEVARFFIFETLGISRSDLLEAAASTPPWTLADPEHPRPRRCLDCGEAMELALVESVPMDFCPSCGSVWLDKDELLVLSHGRFEEGQTESPRAPGPEEGR